MMCSEDAERQAAAAATMDQDQIIEAIVSFRCDFPIDFTHDYLASLSLEKLRHLYLALSLRAAELARRA